MIILDVTAGNRVMWNKNRNPKGVVFIDKEPDLYHPPDILADNRYLPIRLGSPIYSIIFDPPYGINLPPWFLNKQPVKTKNTWGKTLSYYGDFKSKRELFSYIHEAQKEFQRYTEKLCFKWGERNVSLWNILPFFIKDGWKEICRVELKKAPSSIGKGKSKNRSWWITLRNENA